MPRVVAARRPAVSGVVHPGRNLHAYRLAFFASDGLLGCDKHTFRPWPPTAVPALQVQLGSNEIFPRCASAIPIRPFGGRPRRFSDRPTSGFRHLPRRDSVFQPRRRPFSDKTTRTYGAARGIQTKSADSDKNVCLNVQTFVLVLCDPGLQNKMSCRSTFFRHLFFFLSIQTCCSFYVCFLVDAHRQ